MVSLALDDWIARGVMDKRRNNNEEIHAVDGLIWLAEGANWQSNDQVYSKSAPANAEAQFR